MRIRPAPAALLVTLVAGLSGCTGASAEPPAGAAPTPSATAATTAPLPAADAATVDRIVAGQMRAGAVPGMAVGVWIPGRGDLVRLDDRLETFVPGVPNGPDITIAQLLGMTSGVFDFTTDPSFSTAFDTDPLAPFPLERVLAILRSQPPAFAPGAAGQWQYSDSNYILLGEIIRKVSGDDPGVFIQREIVDRLHLPGTGYPATPDIPAPASRGYVIVPAGQPEREVTAINPQVPGPAGAMISTVAGLHDWAAALADGTLLSPAMHRVQTTFVDAKLSPTLRTGYGAGLFSINDFVGHNGAVYGFNTAMFRLPSAGATIVVVANKSTNFDGVALQTFLELAKAFYPGSF